MDILFFFFFSSRRRHTRCGRDWSSDVCSSDLSLFCLPTSVGLQRLLPARLNASRGDIHPLVAGASHSGLKEFEQMWGHSWTVLWGPPGCGKTTNVGRQVAACLEGDERVLVV